MSHPSPRLQVIQELVNEYRERIYAFAKDDPTARNYLPSFAEKLISVEDMEWVQENYDRFLFDSPNDTVVEMSFLSEMGFITAVVFSPDGTHVVAGHSTGLVQVRHGTNGSILCTLRHIQFPPRPVYGLEYSKFEERVCYASCTDGIIYRLEIPSLALESILSSRTHLLLPEPGLESLNVQFFGTPGLSSNATPFITGRPVPLSLGISAENSRMAVGFSDSSIKIYDMETQEAITTYKMHKLRLNYTPKKLQRMHTGQVSALCCHPTRPTVMASGSWDETLRIWDTRCKIGCMMTFEGVNVIGNSIDLNRDLCIAGSWQPIEALTTWDLAARKKVCDVTAQNRRPDVDGEYIYACKFWRSSDYNRKGKYAIIGGSGTRCLEVVNLHNRYIACSYPALGSILAVASHEEKIAYGGTAPMFCLASFHDPKHEDVYDRGDNMEDVARWAQATLDGVASSEVSSLTPQELDDAQEEPPPA